MINNDLSCFNFPKSSNRCNNKGENAKPDDVEAPIIGNVSLAVSLAVADFNENKTFPKCLSRCNAPFSVQEPLFTTTMNESAEIRAGDKVFAWKNS